MASIPKIKFGNHTAIKGVMVDFSAKAPNILSKNTKANAIPIPIAKLIPIPPLRFIEEKASAIMVSINADTGRLYFLYNTTK